ncbi:MULTISPECIES: GNAT family N-acetyltransferase [Pseudomonas]|nr:MULTISPECIES: GNAT family N-acetyltransferase [Pseudomonas]MCD9092174.1 GNAT family N-acetyltransferase [Pseudomonas sp. CP-1]MEC4242334.1 GNAT family N-acetyltransferase [Pseudomonas sp. DSV-1]
MNQIDLKSPCECSDYEIDDFMRLVTEGCEVAVGGLRKRVMAAKHLVFLRTDGQLVGVAAMKNPHDGYRLRVANASGVPLVKQEFPYELGWVFVVPAARGNGYAHALAKAAVTHVNKNGIIATSRTDNLAMHRILIHLEFTPSGSTYCSTLDNYKLQLFLRESRVHFLSVNRI